MQSVLRSSLVLLLLACSAERAEEKARLAADLFTREHAERELRASVAGSDCRVLLIEIEHHAGKDLVETIHYGTGDYRAFGGAERFADDRGFRAVVYRNAAGDLWTYEATTREEAQSLRRCR